MEGPQTVITGTERLCLPVCVLQPCQLMSLTVLGANRLDEQCVITGWECQSSKQKRKTKAAWEELRRGWFNYNACVFWGAAGERGGIEPLQYTLDFVNMWSAWESFIKCELSLGHTESISNFPVSPSDNGKLIMGSITEALHPLNPLSPPCWPSNSSLLNSLLHTFYVGIYTLILTLHTYSSAQLPLHS